MRKVGAGSIFSIKVHDFLTRYLCTIENDKEGHVTYTIAFKAVEDADIPYIFEKTAVPANRVSRVRSSGFYRIKPLSHDRSMIEIFATLNPVEVEANARTAELIQSKVIGGV